MEFFEIFNVLSDTSIGKLASVAATAIGLILILTTHNNPVLFILSILAFLCGLVGLVITHNKGY